MIALGAWLYIGLHGWGLHPVLSVAITVPLAIVALWGAMIPVALVLGMAEKG